MTFLTHSDTSKPSNDAVRKDYSITSSARTRIAVDSSTPIAFVRGATLAPLLCLRIVAGAANPLLLHQGLSFRPSL
jgi:hypothetical protein